MNRHARQTREKGILKNMTIKTESTDLPSTAKRPARSRAKPSPSKTSPAPKEPQKGGKAAQRSPQNKQEARRPDARTGSKTAKILELIRRASGATLAEMERATGWQPHSIRGFLSTASKRLHVKIDSSKDGAGRRIYRATN